jgi:hypothetical protein
LVSLKLNLFGKVGSRKSSKIIMRNTADEGITNGPSIFAYLVFGPGEVIVEGAARPIRAVVGCGPGKILGVQARIRGVQFVLVFV